MRWDRQRKLARAVVLPAACALMMIGSGGHTDAETDDDRPVQTKPPEPSPPFKATFKEPVVDANSPLVLVRRSKLPGLVRVVRTGTAEPPEEIQISFIRERDKAFGGQFLAKRKQVGPDAFEYRAELIAPPAAAKYELVATLNLRKPGRPKADASMKVEVVE